MPTFIETQFPIARLSAEAYKERKAGASQTLTGLGKWWGRKPLILVRASILGMLMPASADAKKDREIFLKILTMDDDGTWQRCKGEIPAAAWREAAAPEVQEEFFGARGLKQGLSEAGFTADLVRNGVDGMHEGLAGEHDLLILDVNLPGLDGWQVLKAMRAAGRELPVLFLTARDQVEDRVKGLELGADDYLVKPFAFSELLARVRTLLRRGRAREAETLVLADLELDVLKRRATRAGRRIDLTAKEFALLELFLRRPGEVLSRSFIASQVWDMNFDSDTNVVEVAIRRLRAKVDDDFAPKLIHTLRGMGYVMEIR